MNGRLRFITGVTVAAAAVVLTTELLSLAHALTRSVAFLVWVPALLAGAAWLSRRLNLRALRQRFARLDRSEILILTAISFIVVVSLFLAIVAAPSNFDALSYHVPRLNHWIQNQSMAHYPTHIDRQLWVGPGWEYFALNLQLLAGSSRFVNCVEWVAFIGCVIVTSHIAAQLGAARRGQWFAALFTATIPMAIAQASGSQVDLFAAFWDACSVALILRCIEQPQRVSARDALVLGACLGLAALSKGTAYLFLFPFLVWLAVTRIRRDRLRVPVPMTLAVAAALIMNAGIYSRNFSVYGTVLGRTSGPPLENAIITPASVASNAVRNLVIHGRSPLLRLNSAEERVVKKLHDALGIDVSDGRTSYYGTSFTMQKRPRSEGYVGNPAHLLVLAAALVLLLRRKRSERASLGLYAVSLLAAFVLFCAYLRWQPWNTRLHLPLFVLGAGLAAAVLEARTRARTMYIIATLLFIACLPVLLANTMRPIVSSVPIWSIPREQRYFIEMQGEQYPAYVTVARLLASRDCSTVGLITSWAEMEEPLWEVMRNRSAKPVHVKHVAVTPAEKMSPDICAIVTNFPVPGARSPQVQVPGGWSLVLNRPPLQVYLKPPAPKG